MMPIAATTQPARPLPPADVDRLADEIAELSSHLDAATHRFLTLIRRFDEGEGWATHGALSCAHWLGWRIGLDLGAAREKVRVARALATLPRIDDALRRGTVSYAKTRAMTRVATPPNEATLLEMAQHATASQLERICRGYRRVRAAEAAESRPESLADEELRRFVRSSQTEDGMVRVEARLRPEEAAVLMQAIDVARRMAWRSRSRDAVVAGVRRGGDRNLALAKDESTDVSAEISRRHPALSRADALVVVAESFLASAAAHDTADMHTAAVAIPVELVVHVDAAALREDVDRGSTATGVADEHRDRRPPHDAIEHHATLADGTALSIATAQRLACDAAVLTVTHDEVGHVTHTSRRTRRISTTLRRALRTRDDGCRFPGCTNRITDAHHVVSWIDGGPTSLGNLLSLCRRHHRFVHEHGYRVVTAASGEPRFFGRDGQPVPLADEPLRMPLRSDAHAAGAAPDALDALRAAHAARGLAIDATTAFPRWDGTPLDAHLAVQALVTATGADGPAALARSCGAACDGADHSSKSRFP